jgi:hypothetical protein
MIVRTRRFRKLLIAVVLGLIGAGLVGTGSAQAVGSYSPSGIDATGSSDVTARLQAFLDSVPDGSTISFPAGARYRVEGTLRLVKRNNLTVIGNGALFYAQTPGDRSRSHWALEGGSNIVIRTMTIKGANPFAGTGVEAYDSSREAQHAISAGNVLGLEIDHVTATDVYGDFVYLGAQFGGWVENAYIHDNHFERNGRQGISVTGGRNVRIVNNYIGQTRRSTFDLEPNGDRWGADNVLIANNVIGDGRLLFLASAGKGPVSNVTVRNNVLHRPMTVKVEASDGTRRQNFVITDNVADVKYGTNGGAALTFVRVDGVTVTGNTQPIQLNRGTVGVKATESCGVKVAGNSFPGSAGESTILPYGGCPLPAPTEAPTTVPDPTAAPSPTASASTPSAPSVTPPVAESIEPTTAAQPSAAPVPAAPVPTAPVPTALVSAANGKPQVAKVAAPPSAPSSAKLPGGGTGASAATSDSRAGAVVIAIRMITKAINHSPIWHLLRLLGSKS